MHFELVFGNWIHKLIITDLLIQTDYKFLELFIKYGRAIKKLKSQLFCNY